MNTQNIIKASSQAFIAAVLAVLLAAGSFFLIEPQVGQAVTSGPFTITTTITDEISFLVGAANVTATGSINGITGGQANGSTTVSVRTNSNTGYTMSIAFYNNGTDNAMLGNNSLSQSIRDYPASSTEPTYLFDTSSTSAVFAYTVSALDDTDIARAFLDNGIGACNELAGAYTADRCWMEPQVAGYEIIDRTSSAPTGATSTISFRILVPNNPVPGLVADVYTATATLTAVNQ